MFYYVNKWVIIILLSICLLNKLLKSGVLRRISQVVFGVFCVFLVGCEVMLVTNADTSLGNGYFLKMSNEDVDVSYSEYGKKGLKLNPGQVEIYNCITGYKIPEDFLIENIEYCREYTIIKSLNKSSEEVTYWVLLMKEMKTLGPLTTEDFNAVCKEYSIRFVTVKYVESAQLLPS